MRKRLRILVTGRVQGVGFRPTVYRYARQQGLAGLVYNTPDGVVIEVEGEQFNLNEFRSQIQKNPPPQAQIHSVDVTEVATAGDSEFTIAPSKLTSAVISEVPHDLALCADCRHDLQNAADRRYQYSFVNCTNCGPRFTIVDDVPYDRPRTSMRAFVMCKDCQREYDNPSNRRFDAQPNGCPECGPQLSMIDSDLNVVASDPLKETTLRFKLGQIGAVKGIGGFHLCCSALNDTAIATLRKRKHRPSKAFAVMVASVEEARTYVEIGLVEEQLLTSPAAPIVIVPRKASCALSGLISPDTNDIGIMLAYAPLHFLLLGQTGPLVMTSGNRSEEPLIKDDGELLAILPAIADFALTHNRPIVRRCDDSVVAVTLNTPLFIRRSRGYVPDIIRLAISGKPVLALGAELKNTFCLTRDNQAIVSQHIGDLTDYATYQFYQESIRDLSAFFRITPAFIAHDLHPDYLSTRHAYTMGDIPRIAVQHHHAHVASCMAEHGITQKVIGIALDGTGFGPDKTVWGGEVLVADLKGYRRAAHFKQYPLPGGNQAVVHPWRMALSCLLAEKVADPVACIAARYNAIDKSDIALVAQMVEKKINAPLCSSAGRLFDAMGAMVGLCGSTSYEGQAAIRLQQSADKAVMDRYEYEIIPGTVDVVSFGRMVHQIMGDVQVSVPVSVIAARFHNTIVAALVAACIKQREQESLNLVALSGGVFQNVLLLSRLVTALRAENFLVYHQEKVPPNDGGIALGQAAVALASLS